MAGSATEVGQILSRLHWQCWRAEPPPVEVDLAELLLVLPILIRSGSVGLVWPRLRGQLDPEGAIALAMEAAYAAQVAHNDICRREIGRSVTRLRAAGIEPVLVKGWAVSRLYPAPLVRPAGDIDLVVRHEEFAQAEAILTGPDAPPITVGLDLKHPSIWEERPNEDFWDRTEVIELDGVPVRVLGAEDQLQMLCLHFLRHGGQRPIWLADVAVALEYRPDSFDWNCFVQTTYVAAGWQRASIGLAHWLLGADRTASPSVMGASLPSWLIPAVYRQWQAPSSFTFRGASTLLVEHPTTVFRILSERWQDPIAATVYAGAPMNRVPRLPIQLVAFVKRLVAHLIHRMPGQIAQATKS